MFFPVAALIDGLNDRPTPATEAQTGRQQWLNESYFLYFEELDLAKRLKSDLKMSWCKAALLTHKAGASAGTSDNKRSALAEYHSSLSALVFTRQYYPRRLWLMAPIRYLLKCSLLMLKGNIRLIVGMTNAYRKFWNDVS